MNRKITEKEAMAIFLREYRKYKDSEEYVRKPIAYAMLQAWIEVDRREKEKKGNEMSKDINVKKFVEEIKDIENTQSDNKHCVCALLAVNYIQEYLDFEEKESGESFWTDKKGYSFSTDIGYFCEGLEGLESCLIKRLRECKKK